MRQDPLHISDPTPKQPRWRNPWEPYSVVRFKREDELFGEGYDDLVFFQACVARLYQEEHGGEIIKQASEAPNVRVVLDPPLPSVLARLRDVLLEYRGLHRKKDDDVQELYRRARRRELRRELHKLVTETGMDAYDLRGFAAKHDIDVRTYQAEAWVKGERDGRGGYKRG